MTELSHDSALPDRRELINASEPIEESRLRAFQQVLERCTFTFGVRNVRRVPVEDGRDNTDLRDA